ncbi:MAG: sugar ABC transporter permease [Albidovulum sp.]|nr:sugar ABC transporter permease [Albidovulum sp.]
MASNASADDNTLFVVQPEKITPGRRRMGRALVWSTFLLMLAAALVQALHVEGVIGYGFDNWRPLLYAYCLWACAIAFSRVLIFGESGKRSLFVLPAVMFIVAIVFFPLLFGLYVSFTDWNLSSLEGRKFNGLDNLRQMAGDPYYWNALTNMVYYVLAIIVEYSIAFGLALLLNSEIRARKFFRVAFLLPLMMSPIAVSWMIGKSMLEIRFGPIARFARWLGWESPTFFSSPEIAKFTIMVLDAWTYIPLMMLMLLAGLQAMPKEVLEAAKVDGAGPWKSFWEIVFPIMLPVSVTAVLIRIIFKLKLADIIIAVTAGGPGGATDSITSFIFREYRDRSNVGYGTLLAFVYLIIIILFMTALIRFVSRWLDRPA